MDSLIYVAFGIVLALSLAAHLRHHAKLDREAQAATERGKLHSSGPKAQHPKIDLTWCIGCGACVTVCPEGDVLAVIGGKAAIVNGHKCIGHSLCADVCPVGAIEIVMAAASMNADMPALSKEFETSVPNMFIVGELGGLALIKNAVNQGRDCVDIIVNRAPALRKPGLSGVVDVAIVGSGPAGLSASLRAIEKGLSYVTLESEEFGGTVAKYPRQKLVMTSPVEFPTHGKFKKLELTKEELMKFWETAAKKAGLKVNTQEKVENIQAGPDGVFTVTSVKGTHRALSVILAIGARGSPRKLGVPGEDQPKVMYSLIEADHYVDANILVVGGGDSAVEAAMGLAYQKGNKVILSYRKDAFSRLKERNTQRVQECAKSGKLTLMFNSEPKEIKEKSVIMEVAGQVKEIPNDWVWVFAGGTPPNAFLKQIGVQLGQVDMSGAARAAAAEAVAAGVS
jgi:thioredoxin reductase/Pyruvate/2-oxoacid:ferredoxin oxidoreductase delta subunit